MATLMLVNPRRRARKAGGKKRTARRAGARRVRRAKNPVTVASVKRTVRSRRGRRSGVARSVRRRRNPINGKALAGSWGKLFKNVAVGGVGAVGVDMLWGFVQKYLPASLQPSVTGPGLNDALKAVATVIAGKALSKHTKGLSEQAAVGALIVQMSRIAAPFVAKAMPGTPGVAGVGYMTASRVIPGVPRIGPLQRGGVGLFQRGSPMLGMRVMGNSMLPGTGTSARERERAVR